MLKHGRGRAVLFLREQPDTTPYRDVVWGACSEYWQFDSQLEDERSPYLFDVLEATGEPSYYADRAAQALDSFGTDREPEGMFRTQLIRLAALLTRNGVSDLREPIYHGTAAISEEPYGFSHICEEIFAMDGVAGYWRLAEQLRHRPPPYDERRAEISLLNSLSEHLGESVGVAALDATAANLPARRRYLDEVRKVRVKQEARATRKQKQKKNMLPPTLADVRAYIQAPPEKKVLKPRMKSMNPAVKWGLILDLTAETDRARQLRYLDILRTSPYEVFPWNPERVLPLIRQTDDERVAWQATSLLENTPHPSIRTAALELLTRKERMPHGIELLAKNPGEGDLVRIENVLREEWDDWNFEFICRGIRRYIKFHPSHASVPLLLACYERLACSFCRNRLVDMLVERNALPLPLQEECAYDADGDTRDLFRPAPRLPQ
ncbi:MAG: hypothetical protein H7145_19805 [Akkermansiaceae bacterium]|nr:hypothetical protein [Armatimonadota bacterium]